MMSKLPCLEHADHLAGLLLVEVVEGRGGAGQLLLGSDGLGVRAGCLPVPETVLPQRGAAVEPSSGDGTKPTNQPTNQPTNGTAAREMHEWVAE